MKRTHGDGYGGTCLRLHHSGGSGRGYVRSCLKTPRPGVWEVAQSVKTCPASMRSWVQISTGAKLKNRSNKWHGASRFPLLVLFESHNFVSCRFSKLGCIRAPNLCRGRLGPTVSPGNFSIIKKIRKRALGAPLSSQHWGEGDSRKPGLLSIESCSVSACQVPWKDLSQNKEGCDSQRPPMLPSGLHTHTHMYKNACEYVQGRMNTHRERHRHTHTNRSQKKKY